MEAVEPVQYGARGKGCRSPQWIEGSNMITIDFNDESAAQAVKTPAGMIRPGAPVNGLRIPDLSVLDLNYYLARSQQQNLLQEAHNSRLLKALRKGCPAVDVQRFFERQKAVLHTLAERYIQRR